LEYLNASSRVSPLLWKVFRDNGFWYQKLSTEIKTHQDSSVDWHQAHKFFEDEPISWTEKLKIAARKGYLDGINLLILNGVDRATPHPSTDDNEAIVWV